MMEDEDRFLRNISSTTVETKIPKYMMLPIAGFKNPNFHTFVTTDNIKNMILNSDVKANMVLAAGIADTIGDLLEKPDPEKIENQSTLRFIYRMWRNMEVMKGLLRRMGYLFMIHFYGVQAEYGGRGFTEFMDNKINSFVSQDFHTVLNPFEYIMYNHIVHAVDDGVVDSIVDVYNDKPKYNTQINVDHAFKFDHKINEYMGNKITIKHNFFIYSTYANIKKNSFMVKVGDKVKKGQPICRVGLSGTFRTSFLLFGLHTKEANVPYLRGVRLQYNRILHLWAPRFECALLPRSNYYGEHIEELYRTLDSHKIKYEKVAALHLRDFSYVKQTDPVIME